VEELDIALLFNLIMNVAPGVTMKLKEVLDYLKSHANPKNVEGMARYGIVAKQCYGLSAPEIRRLARMIGTNHPLALQLWRTGIYDARAVAALIADPLLVSKSMMNVWVKDFDNWATCDVVCGFLFDKAPFAAEMAVRWTARKEEFVKRAGFVLMAALAVHDKSAPDSSFRKFFPLIKRHSTDERNFVRKAVNWALRQIGKRNSTLNAAAIGTAREISRKNSATARWIAADALRELTSSAVRRRLKKAHR
jgi:3-methyladenine DNA glycosylase AlkD